MGTLGLQPSRPVPDSSSEFSTLENAAEKKTNIGAIVVVCFLLLVVAGLGFTLLSIGSKASLSLESRDAVNEALKAISRIDSELVAGDHDPRHLTPLVVEAQAKVNEASRMLPDGELKREMLAAMAAYANAGKGFYVDVLIAGRVHLDRALSLVKE